MASVEKWKVIWCICFVFLRTLKTEAIESEGHGPAPEFFRHVVVKPRIFHGREKRSIQSTRKHQDGVEHLHDITVTYNLNGKEHLIDLKLNRELIPKNYFERHHKNGSTVINRPDAKNMELCHYIGKVRGAKNSWAALSTCSGLRGMVYTGDSIHYIEKADGNSNSEDSEDDNIHGNHYLYDHNDLNVNHTCGYSGTAFHHIDPDVDLENPKLRNKRSTDLIHGPYNANKRSRYVELVLVVDQKDYKGHGENLKAVHDHCKEIANLINALYMPLNIFIALVGVVVWTEHDEIHVDTNGDTTLTSFLQYRRTKLIKEHPNDNAQLLTRVQFEGGVVGKALKGPICTYEFSGGVNMDHSPVVGLVATTVAHEMGHNFGMEHDGSSCHCPEEKCIMASSSSSSSPTHWSSCSTDYLKLAFDHGMDYCLRNKPTSLFDGPVCGNGFVEPGEQCDCGFGPCTNPCCNATDCTLFANASCATGECCDFETCRPKTAGSLCRSADFECDLPEYCTGQSEYCPANVYKMDGETCDRGKAYCYQGYCKSHSDQCKLLWGPSGKSSDVQCYKMNSKGNRYGNCGYNRLNQSYLKCEGDNVHCGMLHCIHLNEKLEYGMESVAILSHSFISSTDNKVIPCRTAIVDLGLNEIDPGLAPDGAKCGPGMMCVNQKCMNVSSLRAALPSGDCPKGCNGNGVCNSLGHCHCKVGFAPPYCDYPGTGGSVDSGPATDPHAHWEVITALYVIFFGIVPFIALVASITFYMRQNPTLFWSKKPRSIIIIEKKPSSGGHVRSMSGDKRPSTGSSQIASDHSRASLLQSSDSSPTNTNLSGLPEDNANTNSFHNNLLGQFKGFSITPLPPKSTVISAPSSASPICLPNRPAPQLKPSQAVSPPKLPNNVAVVAPCRAAPKAPSHHSESPFPPALPPANSSSRPAISSPVLDATTSCAAQELLKNIPIRKAPEVPVCSPDQVSVVCETHPPDNKPNKKESYPALTRLASFMARSQKEGKSLGGGSLRINKLDRDALRSLEISNPIPQKEIEVPGEHVLPAGPDKAVVMRAQSLRDAERKPNVHSFGSMRLQSAKRPTSIAVSARPSSPPPPRPPSFGLPGYQNPNHHVEHEYDDCINLVDGAAPLVDIDEESLCSPNDNIYAVIDESPIDRSEAKKIVLPKKLSKSEYTAPTGEYKVPKPLDNNTSAGSGESLGLLGEIVSEIEARNTESIYSSSTLKRKKDVDDDTSSTVTDMSESKSNQIYVNTPWQAGYSNFNSTPKYCASSNSSNSGYMSPISTNQIGEKRTESGNDSIEEKTIPSVSVPDVSAPSYKPYSSSLQRSNGPFAAYYNKSNSESRKLSTVETNENNLNSNKNDNKTANIGSVVSDVKNMNKETPKELAQQLPIGTSEKAPFLNRALPPINNGVDKLKVASKPFGQPNSSGLSSKQKPEINSVPSKNSVVPSSKALPDKECVNGSAKDSKKDTNLVSKPVQNKVKSPDNSSQPKTVLPLRNVPKTSSFRTGRTPLPAPKPVSIPSVKPNQSTLASSSPVQAKPANSIVNGRNSNATNLQPKASLSATSSSSSSSSSSSGPPINSRQSTAGNSSSVVSESSKQDSKKILPPKPAVNKSSNVASLQQKFETSSNRPTNVQKNFNRPNSTQLTTSKPMETNTNR